MLAPLGVLDAKRDEQIEYLWPENVAAWSAWCEVQTQWRVGMNGATGLDYSGVAAHLNEIGISGDERRTLWTSIRAAEAAVLGVWAERRQQQP